MALSSQSFSRAQLVGMMAYLRGILYDALWAIRKQDTALELQKDIERALSETGFGAHDADCAEDGWLDRSWRQVVEDAEYKDGT